MKLKEIIKSITFFDKLLFILLITMSLLGIFFVDKLISSGNEVVIEHKNRLVYRLSLESDKEIEIDDVIIEIKNRKVRVKDSDCPYKICIKQGWIEKGSIICLPNRVVITIENSSKDIKDVDAVTG